MNFKLLPHHKTTPSFEIEGEYNFNQQVFTALVYVKKRNPSLAWNISPQFSPRSCENWGLWEHDVVEVFIQGRDHEGLDLEPYGEFQFSFLEKNFQLIILEPRRCFYTPLMSYVSSRCIVTPEEVRVEIRIDLPTEIQRRFYYLGVFANLGPDANREFYALKPNHEDRPDFHQPKLFVKYE